MRRDEEEFWSDVGLFSVLFALSTATIEARSGVFHSPTDYGIALLRVAGVSMFFGLSVAWVEPRFLDWLEHRRGRAGDLVGEGLQALYQFVFFAAATVAYELVGGGGRAVVIGQGALLRVVVISALVSVLATWVQPRLWAWARRHSAST